MRVTKLIREYVAKEVEKKYSEKEKEIRKTYKTAETESNFNKKLDELLVKWNDEMRNLMNECGIVSTYGAGREFVKADHAGYGLRAEIYMAEKKALNELFDKKESAIENILITLELGGTKDDLEKLIAEA